VQAITEKFISTLIDRSLMRIILISKMFFLLSVLLANISMAEPDSVVAGPYTVSFDMGQPHDSYNITVNPPQESNDPYLGGRVVCYSISIENNNSDFIKSLESGKLLDSAFLQITSFTIDPKYVTGEAYIETIKDITEVSESNVNIKTDKLLIDGQDGAILSYGMKLTQDITQNEYVAAYIPSSDSHALVSIDSKYPWKNGTSQLLETIHILSTHIDKTIELSAPNLG
jgi:hypothetical protein